MIGFGTAVTAAATAAAGGPRRIVAVEGESKREGAKRMHAREKREREIRLQNGVLRHGELACLCMIKSRFRDTLVRMNCMAWRFFFPSIIIVGIQITGGGGGRSYVYGWAW